MTLPPDQPLPIAGELGPLPPETGLVPPPLPASPVRKSGVAFFAVLFALFALLGTLAQAARPVLGLVWSELFALALPALVAATGSNLLPARALLLSRLPPPRTLGLAALVGTTGFFTAGALMALTSVVMPARWLEIFDMAKIFDRPPLERLALSLAAALLAPFCEEIAFRGWLLTALRTRHRAGVAIVLSALFFALMHLDPVRFTALVGLGALYGWLAWRAGSLWPAMLAHAVNNTLGVTLAAAGAHAGASQPRPPPWQLAGAAVVTLVLAGGVLAALGASYRRATPTPPAPDEALARADPGDPSTRFDIGRIPRGLLLVVAFALAALLALALHPARR